MFEALQRAWFRRNTDKRIAKHGWTAIYVGDYTSAPTWAYTIGLQETLRRPELIVFDLPTDTVNRIFWTAYEELKSGALVLKDGERWHEDEEERPLIWRKVHASQIEARAGWFATAVMRRSDRTGRMIELEAYQLVLPDEAGRLPWEDGYDEKIRFRQPALYLPARDYGDAPLSPPEEEALRVADERGWSIMLVRGELEWAYTIGLSEKKLPELVAFAPSADGAANILHDAQAYVARGELILEDGLRWNALDFECCWRRVDASQFMALNALRLSKLRHSVLHGRQEAVETYQLFLPDREGRYPWEPGCSKAVRDFQPLLFEPFDPAQARRAPLATLMRM